MDNAQRPEIPNVQDNGRIFSCLFSRSHRQTDSEALDMTMTPRQRLDQVKARIGETESCYHRPPGSVRLLGVAKVHSADSIRELVGLGLVDIGESYVQEALAKQKVLNELDITWHYIGHIQSNKTREITGHFDWVHSVDRVRIAHRLSEQRPKGMPDLDICLQVNLQGEPSKSGLAESEVRSAAEEIHSLPRIRLRGLMAIPRESEDFGEQRNAFAQVRSLQENLIQNGHDLDTLSMGMSGDMEAAIAEGSTMVRIGTALFGPRPVRNQPN